MGIEDYDDLKAVYKERRLDRNERAWLKVAQWFSTISGQEFCDELVYGTIGDASVNALLRSFGLGESPANRKKFTELADKMMCDGLA
jgi:hypothetical protein